jgi:cytochrome b
MSDKNSQTPKLKVWDLPTRLFHWSLVILVIVSSFTGLTGKEMDCHMRAGYAILALLIFRLAWGLVGSQTARFSDFVKPPAAAFAYAKNLIGGKPVWTIGHNPLGGYMVLLLLLLLAIMATAGLFANDDIMTEGPLAHYVSGKTSSLLTRIHKLSYWALLGAVVMHVSAALFYLLVKKENLIAAMFTGKKATPSEGKPQQPLFANPWLALIILLIAGLLVWRLVKF